MKMSEFVEDCLDKGMTINRVATLLNVSYPAIKAYVDMGGDEMSPNKALAKEVYNIFGVVIEPYIKEELER
jgi:predicted transcriptional regulator